MKRRIRFDGEQHQWQIFAWSLGRRPALLTANSLAPAPLHDRQLTEQVGWDPLTVSPHLITMVIFGKKKCIASFCSLTDDSHLATLPLSDFFLKRHLEEPPLERSSFVVFVDSIQFSLKQISLKRQTNVFLWTVFRALSKQRSSPLPAVALLRRDQVQGAMRANVETR